MADGDAIIIGQQNGGTRPTYLLRSVSIPPNEPTFGANRWDRGAGSTIYSLAYAGPRASVAVFGSVTALAEDRPADGTGVVGRSLDGDGVIGESESAGTGVGGFADRGVGVFGASSGPSIIRAANPDVGVLGLSDGTAVLGWSPGGGWAGEFRGRVVVAGNFTVVGGTKSAAVPHPDGSHRQFYCVESPESWFEDFGEAELVEGRARVALDADFAALVDTSAYHVFLSSYGPEHLFVERRNEEGFDVRAESDDSGKPRGLGTFSYRIVAKRKDVDAPRLAPFEVPAPPEERLGPLEPRELPEVDLEALRPREDR